MQDLRREAAPTNRVAFLNEVANVHRLRRGYAEPLGLHVEAAVQREIGLVDHDGRSGGAVERGESADVVDMSVSADDGADLEFVAANDFQDAIDLVARIDHYGVAGGWITENRAVALQQADRNHFVNEFFEHAR